MFRRFNNTQEKVHSFGSATLKTLDALLTTCIKIKDWFVAHHNTAEDDIKNIGVSIKAYFLNKWDAAQPYFDKFFRWLVAATTTASTLQTSMQVFPHLIPIFTILASSIPLVGFLFPELFFTKLVSYTILVGISLFAGYLKHNDLLLRAELDATIEQNKETILTFKAKLNQFETQLQNLNSTQNLNKSENKHQAETESADNPTTAHASNDELTHNTHPQILNSRLLRASI